MALHRQSLPRHDTARKSLCPDHAQTPTVCGPLHSHNSQSTPSPRHIPRQPTLRPRDACSDLGSSTLPGHAGGTGEAVERQRHCPRGGLADTDGLAAAGRAHRRPPMAVELKLPEACMMLNRIADVEVGSGLFVMARPKHLCVESKFWMRSCVEENCPPGLYNIMRTTGLLSRHASYTHIVAIIIDSGNLHRFQQGLCGLPINKMRMPNWKSASQ